MLFFLYTTTMDFFIFILFYAQFHLKHVISLGNMDF